MGQPREDWPRLASYVVSARIRAGYQDRGAFADAIGVTSRTLGTLERGDRVGAATLAKIAAGVGWTPDSPQRVLGGGEPATPANGEGRPGPASGDPAAAGELRTLLGMPGPPAGDRRPSFPDAPGLPSLDDAEAEVDLLRQAVLDLAGAVQRMTGREPAPEEMFPGADWAAEWERGVWGDGQLPRETRAQIIAIARTDRARTARQQREGRAG